MMRTIVVLICGLTFCSSLVIQCLAAETVSLSGEWRFSLDRSDVGITEQWFSSELKERIKLPGILQDQGYGDEISTGTPWVLSLYDRFWYLREDYKPYAKAGNVKVPFLSQPPRHYLGPAWYQRDIEIPQSWQGQRVILFLERPRWDSTVWLNDQKVGSNNSLSAPHVYELGALSPGTHRLTIRVDSRMLMPYRLDAHSVSDSLASSWNGIVGKIELKQTTAVWIEQAQVFPNVATKSVRIAVEVGNQTGEPGNGHLSAGTVRAPVTWDSKGGKAELNVPLGNNAQLWDEFNPFLHRLTLKLNGGPANDSQELVFGLREFGTQENEFAINGRKTHLRGTHHGGDFPLTGYPPTDVESWRQIFRISKEWGLNHIRFHSWAPPKAAFEAADEVGIYLQPEPGMWNEISPGTPMEKMLYEETERMIKAFGNHPSFVLLSASNEPKGHWKKSLPRWAEHFRREDPRRLYTTGTGHTDREIPDPMEGADYLVLQRLGQKMLRGPTAWFGRDYRKSLEGIDIPVASHELGQWVAYPDYEIIKKFTGYMRPGNYEIFRDSMTARGLLKRNREFALASGRFQVECYKEEIEANLRTPGMGGFQLLDIRDYLGQGTALVGVIDAFWESKGYVTAKEFRRFNNTTVPLARLRKRVFTTAELFSVEVEVAHYGAAPIANAVPTWKILEASGKIVNQGEWAAQTIPLGKNHAIGRINVELKTFAAPGAYKLIVRLSEFENDWKFWVYPSEVEASAPQDIFVTRSWEQAEARLKEGAKVLFVPSNANLGWTSPPLDRVPVFWNRLMGPAWSRMLGTLNNHRHPALAGFPTAEHFDWQWAEIIRNVRALNLEHFPRELEPIVWAIDDWNRNYRLGLIFEARIGSGKLLVSSFELDDSADASPVSLQLRRSLLDYMASSQFQPRIEISPDAMRGTMFDTRIMQKLGAVAKGNSQETNLAQYAIDADPNTYWLVGDPKVSKHPHELTISFPAPVAISGLLLMPRQNHREHEGDIREYVIHVSDDGSQWRELARGELVSSFDPQELRFPQTITIRYLKLTALSGFGPDSTAALAEFAVIYAGPKLKDTDEGGIEYRRSRTATPDIDEGVEPPQPKPTPTPKKG